MYNLCGLEALCVCIICFLENRIDPRLKFYAPQFTTVVQRWGESVLVVNINRKYHENEIE